MTATPVTIDALHRCIWCQSELDDSDERYVLLSMKLNGDAPRFTMTLCSLRCVLEQTDFIEAGSEPL
jgi:hypothetical protein